MNLRIVTPDGVIYEDENIEMVTMPTKAGVITVKDDHLPIITILTPGEISVHKSTHVIDLSVSRGIIEIKRNSEVVIMADTAERAEHIDLDRAEEARKRAEEYLKSKEAIADIEFAQIQAKIEKELARINLGKKYKKISSSS